MTIPGLTRSAATSLSRWAALAAFTWCGTSAAAPPPVAKLLPCAGPCAALQWARLEIERPASGGGAIDVATSMTHIDRVAMNPIGRYVVIGRTDSGITVVAVVDPAYAKPLDEFWTASVGLSPANRFVAFTDMVATHGPGSEYSDKMVYVFDTATQPAAPEGWVHAPSASIGVFPQALASQGRRYVMHIPATRLNSVVTTDLKFTSEFSLTFLARNLAAQPSPAIYMPVTVSTQPDGNWREAAIVTQAPAFSCDVLGSMAQPRVDSIMAQCGR